MFDCAHDVGGSGAARRRRDRRLRMHWRHEQLSLRMLRASVGHHSWQSRTSVGVQTDEMPAATPAPVIEWMTPGHYVTCTSPAPVIEYMPDDTHPAPAPVIQNVALTPDDTCAAPAPVIEHASVAPVSRVNRDSCGLVNPQFSTACEVILQEIPEVRVIERTQEQITLVGLALQERNVAGETTQNIVGSLAVPRQVIPQEFQKCILLSEPRSRLI